MAYRERPRLNHTVIRLDERELIARNTIELGRLVTDPKKPRADFYDAPISVLNKFAPLVVVQEPYRSEVDSARDLTTTLLKRWFSRSSRKLTRIKARRSQIYSLMNQTSLFSEICSFEPARTFLEKNLGRGNKIYMITSFRTLIDFELESRMFGQQAPTSISVGLTPRVVATNVDLSIGASISQTSSNTTTYKAHGQFVYSVQYARISFKQFGNRLESGKLLRDSHHVFVLFDADKLHALNSHAEAETVEQSEEVGSFAIEESLNILYPPKVILDDTSSISSDGSANAESYSDLPSLTPSRTSFDETELELRQWLALREVAASEFLAQEISGATIRDCIQSYNGKPDEQVLKDQLQEMIRLYGVDIKSMVSKAAKHEQEHVGMFLAKHEQEQVGMFLYHQAKFIVESTIRLILGLPQSTQKLTDMATTSKRLEQSRPFDPPSWTNYDLEVGDSHSSLRPLFARGSPPSKDAFLVHMRSTEPMKMFAKYVQLLTPPTMVARNTSTYSPPQFGSLSLEVKYSQFEGLADTISTHYRLRTYFAKRDDDSAVWTASLVDQDSLSHVGNLKAEKDPEVMLTDLLRAFESVEQCSKTVHGLSQVLWQSPRLDCRFSLLVRPWGDAGVAMVNTVSMKLLETFEKVIAAVRQNLARYRTSERQDTTLDWVEANLLFKPLGSAASAFLKHIGLRNTGTAISESNLSYALSLQLASSLCLVLMLSMVSYQWSHVGSFDEKHMGEPCQAFVIECESNDIRFEQVDFACLDSLFKAPVWTFSTSPWRPLKSGLYLSTTIPEFLDLWPATDITIDQEKPDFVKTINFGGGIIAKVPTESEESEKLGIHCHFYEGKEPSQTWPSFHHKKRLLIGSDGQILNSKATSASLSQEPAWGERYHLRTSEEKWKPSGKSDALGLQAPHIALTHAETSTLSEGESLKKVIITSWQGTTLPSYSGPAQGGFLKPGYLDLLVGLEISFCTGNARRTTLWNLFRNIDILALTEHWAVAGYEAAVQSGSSTFQETWDNETNRRWWPQLRYVVCRVLDELQATGWTEGRLQAWRPSKPYIYGQFFKPSWAEMLADSPSDATFALVTQKCFSRSRFDDAKCHHESAKKHDTPLLFTRLVLTPVTRSLLTKRRTRAKVFQAGGADTTHADAKSDLDSASSGPSASSLERRALHDSEDGSDPASLASSLKNSRTDLDTPVKKEPTAASMDDVFEDEDEDLGRVSDGAQLLRRIGGNGKLIQGNPMQEAKSCFDEAFPEGKWDTMPTKSDGLRCGLYAIINSIQALEDPTIPQPTIEMLLTVLHSAAYRKLLSGPGQVLENRGAFSNEQIALLENEQNFSVDQLAAILLLWGRTVGLELALGCKRRDKAPYFVLYPDEGTDPVVVWIHNDDAETVTGLGHYSGMRRLKSLSQPACTGTLAGVDASASLSATTAPISDEDQLIQYMESLAQESKTKPIFQLQENPRPYQILVASLKSCACFFLWLFLSLLTYLLSGRPEASSAIFEPIRLGIDAGGLNSLSDSGWVGIVAPESEPQEVPPLASSAPVEDLKTEAATEENSLPTTAGSLPALINPTTSASPPSTISVRKGNVFRCKDNRTFSVEDPRAKSTYVHLSSIDHQREPLLVHWHQNWEKTFKKRLHLGQWNLRYVAKPYDKFCQMMNVSPWCSELQNEADAVSLETVGVCVA